MSAAVRCHLTRKSITKAIKTLQENVQKEEARDYLDALFEKYMRDGRATRRAKDVLQNRIGEKIQPFPRRLREEKLSLLSPDPAPCCWCSIAPCAHAPCCVVSSQGYVAEIAQVLILALAMGTRAAAAAAACAARDAAHSPPAPRGTPHTQACRRRAGAGGAGSEHVPPAPGTAPEHAPARAPRDAADSPHSLRRAGRGTLRLAAGAPGPGAQTRNTCRRRRARPRHVCRAGLATLAACAGRDAHTCRRRGVQNTRRKRRARNLKLRRNMRRRRAGGVRHTRRLRSAERGTRAACTALDAAHAPPARGRGEEHDRLREMRHTRRRRGARNTRHLCRAGCGMRAAATACASRGAAHSPPAPRDTCRRCGAAGGADLAPPVHSVLRQAWNTRRRRRAGLGTRAGAATAPV